MTQSDLTHTEYLTKTIQKCVSKMTFPRVKNHKLNAYFFKENKSINGNDLPGKVYDHFLKEMEEI